MTQPTKETYLQKISDVHSFRSPIFGNQDILHTIQSSKLFKNSKCFVDLKLKRNRDVVEADFESISVDSGSPPSQERLNQFIHDNFDLTPEAEFEDWDPPDWTEDVSFLVKDTKKFIQW